MSLFFASHFPGEPVMPGVLIIEALAQTGAVAILSQPEFRGKTAYFAAINNAKFKGKVVPGDMPTLETEIIKIKGTIGVGAAKADVGGKLVTTASVPILLDEMNRKGLLKPGMKIAFSGFGGGLTWASAVVEW